MADAVVLTSASGVLSLLDEPDDALKVHALKQLDSMVDHFWLEIASAIPKIEELYDNTKFPQRNLAAHVASKVFYHLEELDDALRYALGAGNLFDVNAKTEYVETLIAKCIDDYIAQRSKQEDAKGDDMKEAIDTRLEAIVERMFDRCFVDQEYKQALGIALESRRLDVLSRAIQSSGDVPAMLAYCFELAQSITMSLEFRQKVLSVLVGLYREMPQPDYVNMCQCLLFLGDYQKVAETLDNLIKNTDVRQALLAYQVAFDLWENQNQPFLLQVSKALPVVELKPPRRRTRCSGRSSSNNTDPRRRRGHVPRAHDQTQIDSQRRPAYRDLPPLPLLTQQGRSEHPAHYQGQTGSPQRRHPQRPGDGPRVHARRHHR